MADNSIPENHHFAKQCSGIGGKDFSDEDDGYHEPPWLHGSAFQPTRDNPDISGLWVEREPGSWDEQVQRVRKELIDSTRIIKPSHTLGIVQNKRIKSLGRIYSRDLHVVHTPDDEQRLPSHSEIRGVLPEDEILQQKLADAAVTISIFDET